MNNKPPLQVSYFARFGQVSTWCKLHAFADASVLTPHCSPYSFLFLRSPSRVSSISNATFLLVASPLCCFFSLLLLILVSSLPSSVLFSSSLLSILLVLFRLFLSYIPLTSTIQPRASTPFFSPAHHSLTHPLHVSFHFPLAYILTSSYISSPSSTISLYCASSLSYHFQT